MLKKRDGLRLKDLKPESIQEVDLSKLHQAIKINLTRYLIFKEALAAEEPTQGAYLSFISPQKNKSASGYFISAFGCTDALPAAEATKSALEAVRSFFEDDVRLDYLKVNAQDATVALLEDSLKKEEKTCSIDELNNLVNSIIPIEFIDELRDTFVEFANAEPYSVPDRFYTSQSEVTKAKKVKLRGIGGAWSLNFEKRVLGSTNAADIQYRDDHTILIRNLTDAMKNQLEQAILERDT
jgi:nucleoid-associated protein